MDDKTYLLVSAKKLGYEWKDFPMYRQPVEIGHFSQDADRTVHIDRREARLYTPPPSSTKVEFDLSAGFREFKWRDELTAHQEGILPILEWIMASKEVFPRFKKPGVVDGPLHTDFVMFRGMMTRILTAPYANSRSHPWRLRVCKYLNTIYICDDADFSKDAKQDMDDRAKRMCYWGYSFESYLSSHIDPEVKKRSTPNNSAGFATVIRGRLATHSLLLVGEVDCETHEQSKTPPANYVELKTHRIVQNRHQARTFHNYKVRNTWAQCYIPGIPRVVFGFRDDDGIVREVKTYETADLPHLGDHDWHPTVCMNFANDFLSWLSREVLVCNPREVVYHVTFGDPFQRFVLERKADVGSTSSGVFLPQRYLDAIASW